MLDSASILRRHEFVIRRLQSLIGLLPIGGYLCFHLATNAAVLDGLETYQRRADQIHVIGPTTLFFLEWGLIFLPILFHGLIGLVIVSRGKRNLGSYPYAGNWRYTLQRVTGVIAFVFIIWHVFEMHGWFRFAWWTEQVARPLGGAVFDPTDVATAPAAIQASTVTFVLYAVGVLACVYHLANGLWTMGITWGVWASPAAQRRAGFPCAAFGLVLAVVGMGALIKMQTMELPSEKEDGTVEVGGPDKMGGPDTLAQKAWPLGKTLSQECPGGAATRGLVFARGPLVAAQPRHVFRLSEESGNASCGKVSGPPGSCEVSGPPGLSGPPDPGREHL